MVEELIARLDGVITECIKIKQALKSGAMDKPAPGFSEFWKLYPKKQDYGAAEEAWRKSVKPDDVPVLMAVLQKMTWPENERYIPWPSRWLMGKRWLDTPGKENHGKYSGLSQRV